MLPRFAIPVAALAALAVSSHAAKPAGANALYAQSAYAPLALGTCSGMNLGCTGVYGIDWLSDGRMVLLTSDAVYQGSMPYPGRTGSKVTLVSGFAAGGVVTTQDIATGFKLPTGVVVVNDQIYVADMDTFYRVPSNNPASDAASLNANREARMRMPHPVSTGSNPLNFAFPAVTQTPNTGQGTPPGGWTAQNSFWHQYMFSPYYHQGKIYAAYSGATAPGGNPTLNPVSYFSGAILAFDPAATSWDTTLHRAAGGLRSEGGIGYGNGFALVSDNQGGYRPMCELFPVRPFTDQFFGYRQAPSYIANWAQAAYDRGQMHYEPSVAVMDFAAGGWRSTTQPLYLPGGPYAGDWLVGDVYSTGIARVAFDSLPDSTGAPNTQAAVFWFAGASTNPTVGTGNHAINRLSYGPDGAVYAGTLRNIGNWAQGTPTQLIYQYKPALGGTQFEVRRIRSVADGFEIIVSKKVDPAALGVSNFTVQQRNWVRQAAYGGGLGAYAARTVSAIDVSQDSLRIHLTVPGIRRINQERRGDSVTHWVTKFAFNNLASAAGTPSFTDEATYAQNWISTRAWNPAEPTAVAHAPGRGHPIRDRIWITRAGSFLRVHADRVAAYRATLRDLRGRELESRQGRGSGFVEFKAPAGTPAVYVLEVRGESDPSDLRRETVFF